MNGVTLENEYAYIKDGKVFLKGYLDMPDRQIGEVKRTEEEAFQYFINRYQIAVNKVTDDKQISPTDTFATFIEWKKKIQCMATMPPVKKNFRN